MIHQKAQFEQTGLFGGSQYIDFTKVMRCISHKAYYVNFRKTLKLFI